jgi:hypothetical protein
VLPIYPSTSSLSYFHAISDYRRGLDWRTDLLDSNTARDYTLQITTTHRPTFSVTLLATADVPLLPGSTPSSEPTELTQSHVTSDGQSVSPSWCRILSRGHDQILISVWYLLFCRCRSTPLTKGGSIMCINHLNCSSWVTLLLAFASYFISDCLWSAFFTSKRQNPTSR